MYGVTFDGVNLGTVAKFAGEPPATKWQAFSVFRLDPNVEHRKGFPTRRQAVAWLEEQYRNQRETKESANAG